MDRARRRPPLDPAAEEPKEIAAARKAAEKLPQAAEPQAAATGSAGADRASPGRRPTQRPEPDAQQCRVAPS